MKKIVLFLLFPVLTYGQVQIGQNIDGEAENDGSGRSVSISSDGTIVAIGAPGNSNGSGHVRVFEIINNDWIQIGQDIDGEAEGDTLGRTVSISSDGTIVAIGAQRSDNYTGYVTIYENINDNWVQIGQKINGETDFDEFGASISLSSDGTIIAIGATFYDGNGSDSGYVQVYENQNGNWTQIGQDINGEAAGDRSGGSIDLSSDGVIIAIGAIANNNFNGQVRVFENKNGVWEQLGEDIDGILEEGIFGSSVSISDNGSIVAVGAQEGDSASIQSGQVRVFKNQNENWVQVGQSLNGDSSFHFFGLNIDLSSSGNLLVVGANVNEVDPGVLGDVTIYRNMNDSWIQIGNTIYGDDEFSFANIVSLSSDGNTLAIGDPFAQDAGHTKVFDLSDLLAIEDFSLSTFSMYPNPASTQITIDVPQGIALEKATIYNHLGQLVLSSKSTTIDTSTLSKGMYIVEVLTAQGTSSKKLIIE